METKTFESPLSIHLPLIWEQVEVAAGKAGYSRVYMTPLAKFWGYHGVSSKLDLPGVTLKESDARTTSAGFFWCEGAVPLLWAPSG